MSSTAFPDLYNATPEQRLVSTLLSQHPAGDAARLAALVQASDWDRVISLSPVSIRPFLHFALTEGGMLQFVQPTARDVLERAKTDAIVRYMRRKTELSRVFTLFKAQQIETVALKGASLAESVYPLPYLRPMQDVDLWIPDPQMSLARSVLEADGYREKHVPSLEKDVRTGREIRMAKLFHYDISVIELHAGLDVHLPDESFETEAIWKRRIQDPGTSVQRLCPRDVLYHLCTHLALRHRFEQGLLWLLDIRLFLARYGAEVEWDELAVEARRQKTSKYIYLCLELARELLGCTVPEAALSKFEVPEDALGVKSLAWQQLWYSNFAVLPPRRFLMLTATRPEERVGFLIRRLKKYPASRSLDGRQPQGHLQGVWSALRWVVSDLRKAYTAFRDGAFSPANLQRAREMEVRRTKFEKAMQA